MDRYVKRLKRHVWEPTGIHLLVAAIPQEAAPGFFYFLAESLAHLECPHCLKPGALVEKLASGDACPKCRQGSIRHDGTCIY